MKAYDKVCQREPSLLTRKVCQREPSLLTQSLLDRRRHGKISPVCLLALVLGLMLGGCGGNAGSGGNGGAVPKGGQKENSASENPVSDYAVSTKDAKWTQMGETFPSMLWGAYTYDEWIPSGETGNPQKPYSKYELDEDQFCESVKLLKSSITMDGDAKNMELTALPIEITGAFPLGASKSILESIQLRDKNAYETLWGSFYWKKPVNNSWERKEWEEEVHGAYTKKYKNNDHWDAFRSLMSLNVIQMKFLTEEKKPAAATFLYEVEGGGLHLYEWEADPETFEVTSKEWAVMEFCFSGRTLMLRREGCTVAYSPAALCQKALQLEEGIPYTDGYANDPDKVWQDLLGFFWYGGDEAKGSIEFTDGGKAVEKAVRVDGNQLTLRWTKRYRSDSGKMKLEEVPGEMTCEYLWTEPFGVILVKDGKYYRYQHSEDHRYESLLGENLGDDVAVGDLSEQQKARLLAEREKILAELQQAFEQAVIHVEIDPSGGKVTMDSSILFDVDKDTISAEGKDYLNRFLEVYGKVVTDEKYADAISEIQVEGHTDTDGDYDYNVALSERRAEYVMQYCLEVCPALEGRISAKGCAYDEPVYDADGNIDKVASRRVVFKFKLKIGETE